MSYRRFLISLAIAAATLTAVPIDDAFQAIRKNDLADLKALLKSGMGVETAGERATTPLLYASAFGSPEAVKLLLDAGANPNAKNAFDATPLMWAVGDVRKVKLLLDKGADVNAKSKIGRTALLLASLRPDGEAVAKLLIGKGADISAKDEIGETPLLNAAGANLAIAEMLIAQGADVNAVDLPGFTPLMNAAGTGNAALVKILLAKGAKPNAVTGDRMIKVKNGDVRLARFTPLLLAATYGPPLLVDELLKAGAKVDAQDIRGMTPLHYAVSSDYADPAIVRLLLAAKADVNVKMETRETPKDWARKFNNPEILKVFGASAEPASAKVASAAPGAQPIPSSKAAVESGIGILAATSGKFLENGGCVACHAQNVTAFAIKFAREKGIAVNPGIVKQMEMESKGLWLTMRDANLLRQDPPGAPDSTIFALFGMSATGFESNPISDSMLHNLVAQQSANGAWVNNAFARAPMEDSPFARTAIVVRMIKEYSWPAQATELAVSMERGKKFLATAKPVSTEDLAFQVLGLKWAGADPKSFARNLAKLQHADGGWGQNPNLASDAYATGEVLFAMAEAGLSTREDAFKKGTAYLLKTQAADGSWHVKSRSPKFQPYFQSGFPYDHDQWISMAGTAWATIALTQSIEAPPMPAKTKAE